MSQTEFKTLAKYGRAIRGFVLDSKSNEAEVEHKYARTIAACAQRYDHWPNDNIPRCR
jgi:hypothetical protein